MIDIDIVMEMTKEVKKLEQKKDRASGRTEQQLKTLKKKFGCSKLKQAQELLKKEDKELKKLDKEYEACLCSFKEKWNDELGEEE